MKKKNEILFKPTGQPPCRDSLLESFLGKKNKVDYQHLGYLSERAGGEENISILWHMVTKVSGGSGKRLLTVMTR